MEVIFEIFNLKACNTNFYFVLPWLILDERRSKAKVKELFLLFPLVFFFFKSYSFFFL